MYFGEHSASGKQEEFDIILVQKEKNSRLMTEHTNHRKYQKKNHHKSTASW